MVFIFMDAGGHEVYIAYIHYICNITYKLKTMAEPYPKKGRIYCLAGKLELSKAVWPFFFGKFRYRRFMKALATCKGPATEEETTISNLSRLHCLTVN